MSQPHRPLSARPRAPWNPSDDDSSDVDQDEQLAREVALYESGMGSNRPMTSRTQAQAESVAIQRQQEVIGALGGRGMGGMSGLKETSFQEGRDPEDPESEAESEEPEPEQETSWNWDRQLEDLWTLIHRHEPESILLDPVLKCFIPAYQPAIGDIDPMIKIPEPKSTTTEAKLGMHVLDEPAVKQSDPTIVDLQLRATSKLSRDTHPTQSSTSTTANTATIRSLDIRRPDATKALAQWCQSVQELHATIQPDRVLYSKRMPTVETLMGVWDNPLGLAENEYGGTDHTVETALKVFAERWLGTGKKDQRGSGAGGELGVSTPSLLEKELNAGGAIGSGSNGGVGFQDLSLPLHDYSRLVCLLADIPVYASFQTGNEAELSQSRATIEALHVLFNLYSEFKNSQHFGKLLIDC